MDSVEAPTRRTPMERVRLAVVMTCFNRRDKTLACLQRLFTQQGVEDVQITLFLLDDGSRDGTPEAVREHWPAARLLHGTGDLYWNRGMHRAYAAAMEEHYDSYIWLNDDTMLLPGALRRMVDTSRGLQERGITGIVAGSTYDARSGQWSYGGFRWQKKGWRRQLVPVEPALDAALPCDTMNGNCTLIPHAAALMLGNLEPRFHHSFGDFDYGLRAREAGLDIYVAPGFVGSCSDNPPSGTWRDEKSSFSKRWKHLRSPKGSPFQQWAFYCHRHLGVLWPLYAVSPYAKTLTSLFRPQQWLAGR